MKLLINGTPEEIKASAPSITEILKIKNVEAPDMVSVQLNDEFVQRSQFDSTIIKENDAVDFLYFMGGGSGQRIEAL
jgi:sulfur carrier protein